MNKIAVIYKSKYGTTKKYAQWIADELKADIYHDSKVSLDILDNYSTIIYGGGMYMGSVLGVSFITENYEMLKNKNLIVFGVGLEDSKSPKDFQGSIDKVFTEEMKSKIKLFHFRGAIDYKKLKIHHKISMYMFIKMLKKTEPSKLDENTKLIIDTYGKSVDYSNIESIKDLVKYCDGLMSA